VGRADAAAGLSALLAAAELPYRRRWTPLGSTPRRGHDLNLMAVGRVIAAHLVNTDRLDEVREAAWPRVRKDWLQRCLNPSRPEQKHPLNRDFLVLVCDAFELAPRHRAQLNTLYDAPPGVLLLPRPADVVDGPVDSEPWAQNWPPPHGYHALSLLEEHVIGEDCRPRLHRTTLELVADIDDLHHVMYTFDPATDVVEIEEGGQALGQMREIGAGLWGREILFDPPLARGERRRVVYTCHFHHATHPLPIFRRGGSSRPKTPIEIRVRFDPECLPASVTHCVWLGSDSSPIVEAPAELDDEHAVAVRLTLVEPGLLVGLRWTWPD